MTFPWAFGKLWAKDDGFEERTRGKGTEGLQWARPPQMDILAHLSIVGSYCTLDWAL